MRQGKKTTLVGAPHAKEFYHNPADAVAILPVSHAYGHFVNVNEVNLWSNAKLTRGYVLEFITAKNNVPVGGVHGLAMEDLVALRDLLNQVIEEDKPNG